MCRFNCDVSLIKDRDVSVVMGDVFVSSPYHVAIDFYNAQALKYSKANILRPDTVSIWSQYIPNMYVLIYHINYICSFAKLNVDHSF